MMSTSTRNRQIRKYRRSESAVFLKTKEKYGSLSNMASGFPLKINGVDIRTSEALYQACRFPRAPNVQRLIIEQRSPMSAKMRSKPYRDKTRPDWHLVRVKIMRWCLRVKLVQNWEKFRDALLETENLPIVEHSRRDDFWGAKPINEQTLVGVNALGRLLMELRESIKKEPTTSLFRVEPLAIPDFLLNNEPICLCVGPDPDASPSAAIGELGTDGVRESQAEEDYLPGNVGEEIVITNDDRIDLNTASIDDLKTLPNIGTKRANAIIAYRNQNGPFSATEEITAVCNFGSNTYDKLKHLIKIDRIRHKEIPGNITDEFAGSGQISLI